MRRHAGLILLLAAAPSWGADAAVAPSTATAAVSRVRRGVMKLLVHVSGTARPEQIFRLKSTIDGRIETITAAPNMWADARTPLGTLLDKELAALMDSNATTPGAVMEDRWGRVFQPTPILCPVQCFVTRVYAQRGTQARAGTLLVEAAGKLRLVGRVRPGDTRWVQEGQLVRFWAKKDPTRRQAAKIERFIRDVQGERVVPGGTFTVLLTPEAWIDAGAEWEGVIEAEVKKDVLSAPTNALLIKDGEAYLPIRVSTGVTTYDETEIVAGVPEGAAVLVLDPGSSAGVERHAPPPETLERFSLEAEKRRQRKARAADEGRADDEPKPRAAAIEPERWDLQRRGRQKPGAIDVFPGDRPGGERDDRFPSDLR